MPLKPTKHIWFNNKLVPWEEAQIHVLSYALHYGAAVFEGIRAYSTNDGTRIFRLEDHIKPVSFTHLTLPTSDLV